MRGHESNRSGVWCRLPGVLRTAHHGPQQMCQGEGLDIGLCPTREMPEEDVHGGEAGNSLDCPCRTGFECPSDPQGSLMLHAQAGGTRSLIAGTIKVP